MNYKELSLSKIPVPNLDTAKPLTPKKRCKICSSKNRDAIEALYFAGLSQAKLMEKVRVFGVKTTYTTLKKHMSEHYKPRSVKTDLWMNKKRYTIDSTPMENIGAILSEHDDPLSVDAITQVLLSQGLQDVASGKLYLQSVQELLSIIDVSNSTKKINFDIEQKMGAAREDIESAFVQLNAIMSAVQKNVDQDTMKRIVKDAWNEGANLDIMDIDEVPIYKTDDYEEADMSSALSEYGV